MPRPEVQSYDVLRSVVQVLRDSGWTTVIKNGFVEAIKGERVLRVDVSPIKSTIVVYRDNGLIPIYFYSVPDFTRFLDQLIDKPAVPQPGEGEAPPLEAAPIPSPPEETAAPPA